MRKLFVFDVDGVLADFTLAFLSLCNRYYGTPVHSIGQQPTWLYAHTEGGLDPEREKVLWDYIKKSPGWWLTLNPLVTPGDIHDMHAVAREHDVMYLTSRIGKHPGRQTTAWLRQFDFPEAPVIVNNAKHEFLEEYNREGRVRIIEDRPDNIIALQDAGVWTATRDWPYNRCIEADHRVGSVSEFCDVAAS